jgi:DNA-binding IclR family transcriptional regulator
MSTSMMCGLQLRHLIRQRLQEAAEQIPGTVGFLLPDRFHLVYLEFARAAHALGLHAITGSRIAMSRTATGHAYTAALDEDVANALLSEMDREIPQDAKFLHERIAANRVMLRERGYVTACGLWNPHISGIAAPMWSPQYQTYVVVTIGVLSAIYDEQRLVEEIAPTVLKLSSTIGALLQNADGDVFGAGGLDDPAFALARPTIIRKSEDTHDLEAGTRRTSPARSLRAPDGRRRQGQAPA